MNLPQNNMQPNVHNKLTLTSNDYDITSFCFICDLSFNLENVKFNNIVNNIILIARPYLFNTSFYNLHMQHKQVITILFGITKILNNFLFI